ncbi:septum formation inhibitor Maf [Occultella glacieicola]|uniref:Nucleoside triphosphate pyrophosphatase n=1 Tax=Occultella glacieicola TaxID=2518684 RepID=A0ABY2E2N8_9MICO|nr:Maf family protein [Occultella glacieicola]TDE93881.1 septum formation inhibitor Maf [Occultella glacieicola]
MRTLLLASASPARAATLRAAGLEPLIRVADLDEDAVLREHARSRPSDRPASTVAEAVLMLARAKAEHIAQAPGAATSADRPDVILGCDSLLELDGRALGKPGTVERATGRWRLMRGRTGVLHTGHWLIGADGRSVGRVSSTTVHFADLTDAEIEAYVRTGEPLAVAGAFTIDGLGGAFITGIEGDHHGVVGISLPLLRTMLGELGLNWTDFWS